MASRRETRSGSGLGAPGSTGAEKTRDPLGAPGTTGAAPTSGGFDPASYDPAAQGQGQGQQHRPLEPIGYDLGGHQDQGQQHRPSGYDPSGYDLGGQGRGQQHHAPGYDPSGYDLGHQGQGQGQGQQHHSGGGGNLTGSGMEQQSGTRGRETIQITTTTGAFDMPTSGYGVTTGLPTTTATGGYGGGLDAGDIGTTDLGTGDIAGTEGRHHGYTTKDLTGTRDQRK